MKQKVEELGKVKISLAGVQYYEGIRNVEAGSELLFEREPDNVYDRNAIRVDNADFEPVGHIPRFHSRYLAPLIDSGRIGLKGCAVRVNRKANDLLSVVKIFKHEKGKDMFEPSAASDTTDRTVRNIILHQYHNPPKISREEATKLQRRLLKMASGNKYPEVFLAINLLKWRIHKQHVAGEKKLKEKVGAALSAIEIGEPVYYNGLTVFPLEFGGGANYGKVKYDFIEDLLEQGMMEICEVSESGSVPELLLKNKSNSKVLLLDGEELVGAKQNRILNIPILAAANQEILIPVSCVEQGRWEYRQREFSSGAMATSGMRMRRREEVLKNIKENGTYAADQGCVWADVAAVNCLLAVESDSEAMSDAYASAKDRIDKFRSKIELPEGANGYVACLGDRVLGSDIFNSSQSLKRKWPKILSSCAMETVLRTKKTKFKKAKKEKVSEFISNAGGAIGELYSPPGEGAAFGIDGPAVVGNALVANEEIIHICLFERQSTGVI